MTKTSTNYSQWFIEACAKAARDGHTFMMRAQYNPEMYLYYKPHGLSLALAEEKPEGYELGCNERVPRDHTVEQLIMWVTARSGRLPVLPGD